LFRENPVAFAEDSRTKPFGGKDKFSAVPSPKEGHAVAETVPHIDSKQNEHVHRIGSARIVGNPSDKGDI
jgi:hypothetical protein